jgi:hypothetical protein
MTTTFGTVLAEWREFYTANAAHLATTCWLSREVGEPIRGPVSPW